MNILAAVSGQALAYAVVWVLVAGLIFWLLSWLIGYLGVPEPFSKIAKAIVAIIAVLFLINALLTIVGKPFISW